MNLKLIRPDYIKDRMKNPLDYSFFGQYKKKYKNKIVFTGGFGANTEVKIIAKRLKPKIMLNDHKAQLNNIIRTYNNTFKKQIKEIDIKTPSSTTMTERGQLKSQKPVTRNVISSQPVINTYDQIDSTKRTTYSRNNSNNRILNNKSGMRITTLSLPIKKTKIDLNEKKRIKHMILFPKVMQEQHYRNKRNIAKYDKSIFKKHSSSLIEKLKLRHDFFMQDNESKFERNKYKMFRTKDYLSMQHIHKHSVSWISMMIRKVDTINSE